MRLSGFWGFSRRRSRRVPVLKLGSRGPGGDARSLRCVRKAFASVRKASASVRKASASVRKASASVRGGSDMPDRRKRRKSSRNVGLSSLFTFGLTKVSTVKGIGGVVVANRRTVVTFGLVSRLRVSKVSAVTGIGGVVVDEYVCESMFGEDCTRASSKYIKKVAAQYKDNVEIPFTYRNNVSLALQRIQTDEPTASQAKELINYITRAIVDSHSKFEGSCRWCPWCLNIIPASVIRCPLCNVQLVSVGRFMDQSSLGKPRSLDSEVVVDVEESTIADIDVAIEPDLEDPEDEAQAAQNEQDLFDANVEAIIDADPPEDTEEVVWREGGFRRGVPDDLERCGKGTRCNLHQHRRDWKDL